MALLLDDGSSSSHLRPRDQVTDRYSYQVAAAQLAVDCKIEQGSISKTAFTVEEEAHCPDLLLRQRPFGPDLLADIPRNSFLPR